MSIQCALIEDEPLARKVLKGFIHEVENLELKVVFKNGVEAYQYLSENRVDLLFLDLKMPKLNGNDLLDSLPYNPYVIFTTAYRDYALDSFEHKTIDYLTKPIAFPRFLKAINKAREFISETTASAKPAQVNTNTPDFLFLKFSHQYQKVFLNTILWIEGLRDYQKIVTSDQVYFYYATLRELENGLPGDRFLRVHQSFIINMERVKALKGNQIFVDEHAILIGRKYRDHVKLKLGIQNE
jgi:two-component system LytT family response regulator